MTVFCDNYGCIFIDEFGFCDCDNLNIVGGVCDGSYHNGRNAIELPIVATPGGGMLTAEHVREAIFNNSSYASYDGARYYADGIRMQAVADELNARAERTCHIEMYPMGLHEEDGEAPICSACRVTIDEDVYYCSNCGARVEEDI